jgi:hypothetical protein
MEQNKSQYHLTQVFEFFKDKGHYLLINCHKIPNISNEKYRLYYQLLLHSPNPNSEQFKYTFSTWSNEPPPLSENIPIPYNRHVRQPHIRNLPQPITKQFQNQQPNLARHPLEQGFEIMLEKTFLLLIFCRFY